MHRESGVIRIVAAGSADGQKSFDDIRDMLRQALPENVWICEVYPDHVIAQDDPGDKYWQYPYTIADDQVTLGQRVEVERQYVKVQAASRLSAAMGTDADGDYGYRWRVQINEAGVDLQKIADYSLDVLKAASPLYEGARVFALSQGQHTSDVNPYGKSVRDLVGWLSDVVPNAKGLEGTLNILKSASWLRDMALDAWKRGKRDLIGLSHDVLAKTATGNRLGPKKVEKIVRVDSVDVVYDPIAGGKFLRMAAAKTAGRKEAEMLERLLAALRAKRPDLYATIEAKVTGGTVTEEEVLALLAKGLAPSGDGDMNERIAAAVKAALADAGGNGADVQKVLQDARLVACSLTLKDELKESGLPDLSQERLRKQFGEKVFELEVLRAAIKDEKEYVDKLTGSGTVTGSGQIRVGNEEPERIQAAMDKLFGVTVDDRFNDVPAFASIRAAYTRITGDTEVRGILTPEGIRFGEAFMGYQRMPAAFSTSSFSYALGNTLYRRLIQDYRAVDYGEQNLISYKRNAKDFKTMESVRIGYFGDLPDVDPQAKDYEEISMVTDEEISYALNQKGVILTVNRIVIINDDLRTVQTLIARLGRAARRTYARRGWNKINDNATYKGDSKAMFHSDHGNLGSVALTNDATGITTLTNRLVAMFNQTEKDSGEVLALDPKYLWVARSYLEIAKALNSPWPIAGTINPHAGRFGVNHERILVNKLATDTNDWGLIADPADSELLEVAFLNGQEEPELFVADNPLVGQMFVGDKIQYKQRHEYEWEVADYRGFDKSVCAA